MEDLEEKIKNIIIKHTNHVEDANYGINLWGIIMASIEITTLLKEK